MRLFEQAEDGEGQMTVVAPLVLAPFGVNAGLVDAAQERGDNDLLLPPLDFI